MNDDSEFDEWVNLQPVGLRSTLLANPAFALQQFKKSAHAAPVAAPPPLVPTPPVVEPPPQEPPQEVPAEVSKHPRRRSFWTSRSGEPTFHISRSMANSATAGPNLSNDEQSELKRQRKNALYNGSVDISRDTVLENSSVFVDCGDDDGESLAVEAAEPRRRSRLLPTAQSTDGATSNLEVNLANGIQTLLSQNLVHMDPANADRSLASYLHPPSSPIETAAPVAPPPTPVPRLVVTKPLSRQAVDDDSSESDDDVNPHTVHAARARAIAARNRLHVR